MGGARRGIGWRLSEHRTGGILEERDGYPSEKGLRTGGKPVRLCVLLRTVEVCPCTLLNRSSDDRAAAVLLADFRKYGSSMATKIKIRCYTRRAQERELFVVYYIEPSLHVYIGSSLFN